MLSDTQNKLLLHFLGYQGDEFGYFQLEALGAAAHERQTALKGPHAAANTLSSLQIIEKRCNNRVMFFIYHYLLHKYDTSVGLFPRCWGRHPLSMCRQELSGVVLSLNSSSMKPYGDILPWSSIDHFPWHVSTSSLQQLLSADLISLWDLTGWDAWKPTAAPDAYLL